MDAPVVVVGAGLAGLACAVRLHQHGIPVQVLEASDDVGGRVRTDLVDGFRCDRGFQLLNPAYPEVRALGLAQVDLRSFAAGVVVAHDGRRHLLGDPRRLPSSLPGSLLAGGELRSKLAFLRWAAPALGPVPRLLARPDRPRGVALDRAGVTGRFRSGVVEAFLAGVLAEDDGSTSEAFTRLLVRAFALGRPGVPAAGMGAVPRLLSGRLPADAVRTGVGVVGVGPNAVRTDDGVVPAAAVVVATDPATAGTLTGLPVPDLKALTTWWFATPDGTAPSSLPVLHLDGDRDGPVVNTAVLTSVAPELAPPGRHLVAATALGLPSADVEETVRAQVGRVFGVPTGRWETVVVHRVAAALPAQPAPLQRRRPVVLEDGLLVAGDHRDTASQQGALVSGRRAADAVLTRLGHHEAPRPR